MLPVPSYGRWPFLFHWRTMILCFYHFYSCRSFYSLDDFARQLAAHNRRSNNFPMRPLNYCSPSQFTVQYV